MKTLAMVVVAAGIAASATADVVVPNFATGAPAGANGLNTFIRDLGAARSGQLLMNASQLGAVAGQQIVGIQFRLWTGATNNFGGATWADYTINMGQGVAFGSQTTTFANNFVGAPVNVRSGPLSIPANAYTAGGSPNAFGPTIMFDTPYTYTGGNLLIEIRHPGSDIINPVGTFLEVADATHPQYNVDFWSATATGATATTGAQATFTVTNLVVIPAPAGVALLGLGGLVATRRRR